MHLINLPEKLDEFDEFTGKLYASVQAELDCKEKILGYGAGEQYRAALEKWNCVGLQLEMARTAACFTEIFRRQPLTEEDLRRLSQCARDLAEFLAAFNRDCAGGEPRH